MQGRPPSGSSVCRNAYQPDLTLFGERALAVNSLSRPSSVLSYGGAVYTPYARSPSPRGKNNSSLYSSFVKGCSPPTHGNSSPTQSQDDGQGIYYIPANSPAEFEIEAFDRPASRQMKRPVSGQKGLRKGRPLSGRSSLEQEFDRSRVQSALSDIDLDHEPMTDVLSRLGDYTHNFKPEISLANTDCECKSHDERVSSRLARVYDSDNGDSSESDDEGVMISMMLKTFQQFEDKGHSSARQKAMLTLLNGLTGQEILTQSNTEKLLNYLRSSLVQVQDACLSLLKSCAKMPENVKMLLDCNIMEFLYSCVQSEEFLPLARPALLLLEVIFSQRKFKDIWLETAYSKFMPDLLRLLKGQFPLEVKYAACCVFRSLAQYEEFIVHVTDVVLPTIIMMRNSSAKFKEIYVVILTTVLANSNCLPPDLVDNSAIPITASIIREGPCGPQCAALHLLSSLTTNDTGIAMVIGTSSLVQMVLCCMRESHCRKVRLKATEVIKDLSSTRKLGLCKDLMLQLSSYLVPDLEKESLTSLSLMANPQAVSLGTRPRFDEERRMWQGLEKFVDMTKDIIYREAKVEVDGLDTVTKIHMKPGIDVCPTQLAVLSHSLHILQSMCLWPLDKSRLGFSANKIDLTTFTDDEKQMARLSKVNRGLTQAIWDKIGVVVTDLLSSYASRFKMSCEQESHQGKQPKSLEDVFEAQEVQLIMSMLELLLCAAICTCSAFPEILPNKQENSPNKQSKSTKLKSVSTPQIHSDKDTFVSENLKSQSEIGNKLNAEGDKIWVTENPHLTSIHLNTSHNATVDRSKAELKHKEACTERRLLRKCLFEAGIFHCVCPFLMCSDGDVQILVLQILRCLIQPLEERVAPSAPKLSYTGVGSTSSKPRQRPRSAFTAHEAQRKLNIALYKMSPDLAGLIKEALGPRIDTPSQQAEVRTTLEIPGQPGGLETIQERLQEYTDNMAEEEASIQKPKPKPCKPLIDRCRPIAQQCRELLLEEVGERLVKEIFNKSKDLKKQCVLLLYDLVQHGEVSTHMKLSEYGCMPKLVDYLRVNEDDEILEIIGLIVVRLLVKSDIRLKQLFNRHGGPALLIAMAQYTKGLLKQEVSTTLKTVTKVDTTPMRKRPMSAPVKRTDRPPDIWDHIQSRWQQEDQVQTVLRQWMQQ